MNYCFVAIVRLILAFAAMALPAQAQMQRAMGIDATGFGQPVPAFAVTVPQGWQTQGGIIWGNSNMCNPYGYDYSWSAMSTDQRYGVAVLPAVRWTNSAQSGVQGCPVLNINSSRDAINTIVKHLLPKAQMIDYRQRPDFLQEIGAQPSQFDLGYGAWMKTHVDAGEALFGFTDERGTQMRVTVGLVIAAHETFMPGGGVMADMRFIQGQTFPAWLAFAPDGQLDMAMSEQMRTSIQINPAWQKEINNHHRKIDKGNRQTQANISKINRDTNSYISRLNTDSHNKRMAAMDRSSRQFSDTMLERDNWRDTDGSRLNAPSGGANMWRLDNGDLVTTDDHNFNPLQSTGQFGTQLERWE